MLGSDPRTVENQLVFGIKDLDLRVGQSYLVPFTAENFNGLEGYQFSLFFDSELVNFIDLKTGKLPSLSMSNFGFNLLEEGYITTSWTSHTATSVPKDTVLFYVGFTAKKNTRLSEVINVSGQYTRAEAYTKTGELWDVGLRFDKRGLSNGEFRLYQNLPNPFYESTLIGFELPEASFVTLEFIDASGLEVKRIARDFPKGYNSIVLPSKGLSSGILYYRMTTPGFLETKRMILQQ